MQRDSTASDCYEAFVFANSRSGFGHPAAVLEGRCFRTPCSTWPSHRCPGSLDERMDATAPNDSRRTQPPSPAGEYSNLVPIQDRLGDTVHERPETDGDAPAANRLFRSDRGLLKELEENTTDYGAPRNYPPRAS
jgi:hypothetical protein